MAFIGTIIIDPDNLLTSGFTTGTGDLAGHYYTDEIHLNCVDKTFHFKGGGNLNTNGDGVTGQALYSFFKDRWQGTASITAYDFPMLSITNEQFEFVDGWIPDDGATTGTISDLTFTAASDTILSTNTDFSTFFQKGDLIEITGSTSNDGVYTIENISTTTNPGDTITVLEDAIADEGTADASATFTSNVVKQTSTTGAQSDFVFADNGASPDTITNSGSVDFTDLFAKGDTIVVSGTTTNDGTFTIDAITSTVITLISTDTLTNQSPGTATITNTFRTTTSKIVRTAGWSEVNAGVVSKRVSGIVTLGTLVENGDQPYFAQDSSFTASTRNTEYTGPVNEAVRIYSNVASTTGEIDFVSTNTISSTGPRLDVFQVGDVITVTDTTNNNTTYTVSAIPNPYEITTEETVTAETPTNATLNVDLTSYYKIYVRERGKIYADSDLTAIGVTTMTYIVYRFPVSNATDLNLETSVDTELDAALTEVTKTDINFTGATTFTSASGLDAFATNDLIKIIGSSNNDGFYKVSAAAAGQITITQTGSPWSLTSFNTVDDAGLTVTITEVGVADVSPYDKIQVTYLPNPDSETGTVNIRGPYTQGSTYALGDVVYDVGNSSSNADGARWYYLDAILGTPGTGADLDTDNGVDATWTLWDKSKTNANGDKIGGERWVNDAFYAYSVIIDTNNTVNAGDTKADSPYTTASGADKEAVYDWCQWALRQPEFIDWFATRNGNVADLLTEFVGSTLETANGVFIDDLAPADTNNVVFNDYSGIARTYPLVVTVTINFNNNLSDNTTTTNDAVFYAYYKDPDGVVNGNEFGTTGALQVQRSPSGNVGSDVSNLVPESTTGSTYTFSYAYDGDTTGGRTPSTDVDIVVVAIGLDTGQYVQAEGTIESTGGTVSLVAPLERNYSNPT